MLKLQALALNGHKYRLSGQKSGFNLGGLKGDEPAYPPLYPLNPLSPLNLQN